MKELIEEIKVHITDWNGRPASYKFSFRLDAAGGLVVGALCGVSPDYDDTAPWAGYLLWDYGETETAEEAIDRLAGEIAAAIG